MFNRLLDTVYPAIDMPNEELLPNSFLETAWLATESAYDSYLSSAKPA